MADDATLLEADGRWTLRLALSADGHVWRREESLR